MLIFTLNSNYLLWNYLILASSIILLILVIKKFNLLLEQSDFSFPLFEYNKEIFTNKFKAAINLEKYKQLIIWDCFFAIVYSMIFFCIINISNYYSSYYIYKLRYFTIPIHIFIDLCENYIGYLMINEFQQSNSVKLNVHYFYISSIKWGIAAFNIGISFLSILVTFANQLRNDERKKNLTYIN